MTYTLKPFQEKFVEKAQGVTNVLLADEMGLGKTVEAIALDKEKRTGRKGLKTLVIAPLSVVDVWRSHYGWMLPEMKVSSYDPTGVSPAVARQCFLDEVRDGNSDVYVIHWDALRKLADDLVKHEWFHVIADEAHRAKNRKAQQTVALKRIRTPNKTACTGTPAETRPHDLWSILNWLYPNKFRSYWKFYDSYVDWKKSPQGYRIVTGVRNVEDLHREIRPFYFRRLKQHVLKDLPDRYYTSIEVNLTPQQRKRYDQMKKDMLTWVGEHEDEPLAAPAVIARLMRLQQFAISDCTIEQKKVYTRLRFKIAPGEYERRRVRWGQLITLFEKKGFPPPKEWTPETDPNEWAWHYEPVVRMCDPSSKLDAVMQLAEDNPDEPLVVFSQFKQVIDLLGVRLQKHSIPHGIYTGDTEKHDRDRIVRDFQGGGLQVFAGTIRAGGEGITLTRSSTVIFIDRDWSPSKNRQAEDRTHRMGQKNAVQVIDIVAKGTLDRGRLQQIEQTWGWLKKLLGDTP
jgi:SNF2 family DNA or RNA helicase